MPKPRSHAVLIPFTLILLATAWSHAAGDTIKLVPFHQVEVTDNIWQPRVRQLVAETLPHAFKQTEVAQERLRLCAEWLESGGKTPKPKAHRFKTSDLYKVMEGAALMIKAEPNNEIEGMMDRIIDIIARAQKDDGYLYVSHIVGNPWRHVRSGRAWSELTELRPAAQAGCRSARSRRARRPRDLPICRHGGSRQLALRKQFRPDRPERQQRSHPSDLRLPIRRED